MADYTWADSHPPRIASSDPFVEGRGEKSYLITAALRQRIELVRHLVEFGRQVIVLTGPGGVGKSALLDQIAQPQEKSWNVIRFAAGPTLNRHALLTKIAHELGIDRHEGPDALVQALHNKAKTAAQAGEIIVLAIDNADALPIDVPACLLQLAHAGDESSELKVIMTADPTQSKLVDQLQSEASQHALVHVVEIPRLTAEQTRDMLIHRWRAAYGNEEIPLEKAEISQIHRQSGGVAGKAIVLARQVQMLNAAPQRRSADPARRYLAVGVAILSVLVAFAFFAHDSDDPAVTQFELALPDEDDFAPETPTDEPPLSATIRTPALASEDNTAALPPSVSIPEAVVDPEDHGKAASSQSVAGAGDAAAEPLNSDSAPTTKTAPPVAKPDPEKSLQEHGAETIAETTTEATIEATAATAAESHQANANNGDSPETEPNGVPAPSKPVVKVKLRAATEYSVAWLLQQPDGGYVLQLFGVRDRDAAVSFVSRQRIAEKSTILATEHDGAPWYVVLYGHYPDRDTAQAAIRQLPENLRANRPWARPIASLK